MKLTYSGISKDMLRPELIGRKVFRRATSSNLVDEDPKLGRVVAYDNRDERIYVVWNIGDMPHHFRVTDLMLVKDDMGLTKTLKWSGKTLGALEKFVDQVQVEGGNYDTVLNPGKHEHIGIMVELPLATDSGKKHNHEFTEPCGVGCPAHAQYFGPKDQV